MDRNAYLIELSASDRAEFSHKEFGDQSPDQRVFSAVWALLSEAGRGGFAGYFMSWDGDTAGFAPEALERIGATDTAALVRSALHAVSPEPFPDDYDEREALVLTLDDEHLATLERLGAEFRASAQDVTECLFAFVAARPETFGPVPPEA